MAATLYVDTSLLMSAFSNEPDQALALKVLQAPQWTRVCVSDWTLAEFACAVQAKVMRGDTPAETAYAIHQTIKTLLLQGALHQIAVLRGDYATVQRVVTGLTCLIRAGGGASPGCGSTEQHHALCKLRFVPARCGGSVAQESAVRTKFLTTNLFALATGLAF